MQFVTVTKIRLRGKRMSDKNNNSSKNTIFIELLAVLFIALKLLGKINWSWWWVLSPIWIQLVIVLIVFIVFYFIDKDSGGKK